MYIDIYQYLIKNNAVCLKFTTDTTGRQRIFNLLQKFASRARFTFWSRSGNIIVDKTRSYIVPLAEVNFFTI